MNADYVENIIRNIDKQSYKCILVDGASDLVVLW